MTSGDPVAQSQRQPARTEAEAKQRYLGYLRQSVRCIHPYVELRLGPLGAGFGLLPTLRPIPLTPVGSGPLWLTLDQHVEVIPDTRYPGEFRCTTRSYYYGVFDTEDFDVADPIVAWHWNPADKNWPGAHVHLPVPDTFGRRNAGEKLHIPTGPRVSIERVIRFLIQEKLAAHVDEAWETLLNDSQDRFDQFQTQDAPPY